MHIHRESSVVALLGGSDAFLSQVVESTSCSADKIYCYMLGPCSPHVVRGQEDKKEEWRVQEKFASKLCKPTTELHERVLGSCS